MDSDDLLKLETTETIWYLPRSRKNFFLYLVVELMYICPSKL